MRVASNCVARDRREMLFVDFESGTLSTWDRAMGMSRLLVIASIAVAAGPPSQAPKDEPAKEVGARLYIHQDANLPGLFIPSGFMPDGTGIEQNVAETNAPHSGKNCVRVKCELS